MLIIFEYLENIDLSPSLTPLNYLSSYAKFLAYLSQTVEQTNWTVLSECPKWFITSHFPLSLTYLNMLLANFRHLLLSQWYLKSKPILMYRSVSYFNMFLANFRHILLPQWHLKQWIYQLTFPLTRPSRTYPYFTEVSYAFKESQLCFALFTQRSSFFSGIRDK